MIDLISRQDGKIKVAKGQDPYNVIGNYIREHLTVIEDMIAVIRINDSITNELFLVDWDEEGYFVWHHDWWEGEENVELIDFYPVSDSERLPEPEKQHGNTFREIVVKYPLYSTCPEYKGKPYFSIKYTENEREFTGYGIYTPEVVSEFLKEYFMPSAQPEIIHCGDCKYKDDGIDEDGIPFLKCLNGRSYGGTRINDYCSWAERRQDEQTN